ncbi:MAG: C_GCAxxG_C_C family protein [Dehalococcoidales bacterium]|nr:C_GCAxxG_C_C family protein [Dehalococcoidales bacterium]
MEKSEAARALMVEHRMNCAQSVLSVFCGELKLNRNQALKIAMGFGGGMGRTGNICGAVTGAYMVLGLSQQLNENNPRESVERTYKLVREFNRKFKEINGSLVCRELIRYDLGLPEGLSEARSKGVFSAVCPKFVADSVKILETLLATC